MLNTIQNYFPSPSIMLMVNVPLCYYTNETKCLRCKNIYIRMDLNPYIYEWNDPIISVVIGTGFYLYEAWKCLNPEALLTSACTSVSSAPSGRYSAWCSPHRSKCLKSFIYTHFITTWQGPNRRKKMLSLIL